MTITARFPGQCKRCGQRIEAGESIIWVKGEGAEHARVCQRPAVAPPVQTVNASEIAAFLLAAKARGLKYPKARFLAPDGQTELRLTVAGEQSKAPGSINVFLGEAWTGRIRPDGALNGGALATDAALLATLRQIALDPAAAAKAYGALMCRCSFCNLPLTDAGSVEVGYGPTCAKSYGLPHKPKGTPALSAVPESGDHAQA